jgi:hypothetical protein
MKRFSHHMVCEYIPHHHFDKEWTQNPVVVRRNFNMFNQIIKILKYIKKYKLLRYIRVTGKSPCLHPVIGPPFTPYPVFQWYLQSKEMLLNLNMKCWNSAFNAQGSRVI